MNHMNNLKGTHARTHSYTCIQVQAHVAGNHYVVIIQFHKDFNQALVIDVFYGSLCGESH